MPTHDFDGTQNIRLTERMAFRPRPTLRGRLSMADPAGTQESTPLVLGGGAPSFSTMQPTLTFSAFQPAEPPVELDMEPAMPPTLEVLGAAPDPGSMGIADVEFQPEPGEGAVYALLHEIRTPDGSIYDLTLPYSGVQGVVLGSGSDTDVISDTLRFPVNRVIDQDTSPDVPSNITELVEEAVDFVTGKAIKHVLQIFKAPVETALHALADRIEAEPFVTTLEPDGSQGSVLDGFEAWRTRFPASKEYRVLLFLHGFNSNVERGTPRELITALSAGYDAVLGYNHRTFTLDPVQNAHDLLERLPADVRLKVDVIGYSRGGLVARSLVELQPDQPGLDVQRMITFGTPHAGTTLAEQERWDRLISIGFTTASWAAALSGAGTVLTFLPRGLELLMQAGSQLFFDLPGLEAMDPGSNFLQRLNAPTEFAPDVRYAAVTSTFDPARMAQRSFRRALTAMAAQAFLQTPNDLIVPTESMSSIDLPGTAPLGEWIYKTNVDHFSYFADSDVQTFARTFFSS